MRIQVPFKPKTIFSLLVAVAIMDAFSLFFFTRIDTVVHVDLYNYGLQFSYEWARQYWAYADFFLGSQVIALILVGISMSSFAIYARTHSTISRSLCNLLLITGIGLNVFSAYLFTRLDYIVHNDLYLYGLQFSYEWATNYWTYARLLLASISLASATTVISATLVLLSARKTIEINTAKIASSTLIATGAVALVISITYASSILAFIGLGLLFWGIIFTYIRTEEYVKKALLDATVSSQIATLNEIIQAMECEGTATYLPPKYFKNPEANKVYIPKPKGVTLPKPEQIQDQDPQFFIDLIENPPAVLLTPPGAELAKLFEKTLETNFTRVDLKYLQQNMRKLFVEELEIAQNIEMEL